MNWSLYIDTMSFLTAGDFPRPEPTSSDTNAAFPAVF